MSGIVIVGVDGSETAARAAAAAYKLAQGLEARLHVITAFDKDNVEVFGSGSDTFIMSDADDAQRVAKQVAEGLGSDVEYLSSRGKPADALLSEAERLGADVIVVGNRRMSGLGRVLGSVANTVAHNAPCDVYIVNTTEA